MEYSGTLCENLHQERVKREFESQPKWVIYNFNQGNAPCYGMAGIQIEKAHTSYQVADNMIRVATTHSRVLD